MRRVAAVPSLALALLTLPIVAGCAALGLPPMVDGVAAPLPGADALTPGSSGEPAASPEVAFGPAFVTSDDGYALTLPEGWAGVGVAPDGEQGALDALLAADPALGAAAGELIDTVSARVSMVAVDVAAADGVSMPPGVAVLIIPTRDVADDAMAELVGALIGRSAVVVDGVDHKVVTLPAGDADRFDLVARGDVGPVRLRIYLFSVGDDGVVVAFAVPGTELSRGQPAVDEIIKSLIFGV